MTTYKKPPHVIWNCGRCGLPIEGEMTTGYNVQHVTPAVCIKLLQAENERLATENRNLHLATDALIDERKELCAQLRSYKDDPTKALREVGEHDVEQFYREE